MRSTQSAPATYASLQASPLPSTCCLSCSRSSSETAPNSQCRSTSSTAQRFLIGSGRGHVDLGFIESPIDTVMNEQTVATDELIVVVAPDHPWASRSQISLDAILTTPMVLREAGSGTRETFAHHLEELGHDAPMAALELGSTSAVRAAVATGTHPTVISRLAVDADLAAGSLIEIEVPGLKIVRRLRAVWPKRTSLPPLAEALLRRLPDLG